jgi:hypothetical protein
MLDWYLGQPAFVFRVIAVIVLAVGVAVLFSA